MEGRVALSYSSVNSEYAAGKRWQDVSLQPSTENPALVLVAPFHEQDSYF